MSAEVEAVWTFEELWGQASNLLGRPLAESTFRYWVVEVCRLGSKAEYTESDWIALQTWIEFQRPYRRRSTAKVRDFRKHLQELANAQDTTHA